MDEQVLPLEYYVNLTVSNDKLKAFVHFTNVEQGFSCKLSQLEELLKNNHIVFGINQGILEQIARDAAPFLGQKTMVAEGELPVDGKDGYMEWVFDLDTKTKRPMEREDGTVNYKEVTSINNIQKGQIIARRILAEEGKNGKAVTGEPLFARTGKEVRFKLGKNVITDAEQSGIYAAIDGVVVKTDRDKVNVFPIYEVNGDVDFNVGNINFIGSVVIRGNVQPGFKIRAAGDIRVSGGVEAAELEADGSIEITGGILGQNKGSVKAGKTIKSSFIQDGIIEAGEDVIVSQSIMHSSVRAGRSVICQGTKGLIVGGTIQAGEKVAARTVGNSMSTVTSIEVGVAPELRNKLVQLRQSLREHMDNMDKTVKALVLLDQMAASGQLNPERLSMRIKLVHTRKQLVEAMSVIKDEILVIEKSLEDTDKAVVMVTSMIYGGAKVVIGRFTRFIKDPASHVCFKMESGDIVTTANF